jgi:hypothetical protein
MHRKYITFSSHQTIGGELLRKLNTWNFEKLSIESKDEQVFKTPQSYFTLNHNGISEKGYELIYKNLTGLCQKENTPCVIELKEVVNYSKKESDLGMANVSLGQFLNMGPFGLKPINGEPKKADIYLMVNILHSSFEDIEALSSMGMISFQENRNHGAGWDRMIFSLNFTKEHEAFRYFGRFSNIVNVPDLSCKVVLSNVIKSFIQNTVTLPLVKA